MIGSRTSTIECLSKIPILLTTQTCGIAIRWKIILIILVYYPEEIPRSVKVYATLASVIQIAWRKNALVFRLETKYV